MATFHDRTIASKFQRGLLRAGRVPCRVLTSDEVVAEVEADQRAAQCGTSAEVDVRHGGARTLLPAPLPSLSAAFSRRRAIFGAVALAAAPVAVLPAQAAPAVSDEAAALLAEFHDIAGRYNAVGARLDAAMAATARIPAPEELYHRKGDLSRLNFLPPVRNWRDDRHWYGEAGIIKTLRNARFVFFGGQADHAGRARRDEIVDAWDRWEAAKKAAQDASGETAATEEYRSVGAEHDAFVLRLTRLRTADSDIMAVKAALVLNMWGGKASNFDRAIDRVLECDDFDEEPLCYSLMRDMMGRLGDMHRVPA